MITRINGLKRSLVDFRQLFSGSCFLVGGGYQLPAVKDQLDDPRIVTMGMNNSATQFTPNLWVGADSVDHYSASILFNSSIMKFMYMCRADGVVNGKKASDLDNIFFMPRSQVLEIDKFFISRPKMGWWKNVVTMAVELLLYLGFDRIYFVGCGLKILDKPYGYESDLGPDEIRFNRTTYATVTRHMRYLHKHASEYRFSLVSCTPDSTLNEFLPYIPLDEAIATEASKLPAVRTTGFRRPSHTGLLGRPNS